MYMEGVGRVCRGHAEGMQRVHGGDLKFEAYFEVVDSVRTLKVNYCLSLVTIGCH